MAIKAGRVGVDPSQVTLSGYIKGGGVAPEVLTKEEARRIYQTILGMSDYLLKTEASELYQRISDMAQYQLKLVSGSNIKRINGEDLLGSGNITVLTRQLADGIYQKIADMSNYVLKSEIPDLTDLLTKTEAPGYDDILTITAGTVMLNNKLNINGTSVALYDSIDADDIVTGIVYCRSTCANLPSADDYMIVSSGNENNSVQIAFCSDNDTKPIMKRIKLSAIGSIWSAWYPITLTIETLGSPNLNTLKTNFHGCVLTCTDNPSNTSSTGLLLVINGNNDDSCAQLYIPDGSTDVWVRTCVVSTWSSWVKQCSSNDLASAISSINGTINSLDTRLSNEIATYKCLVVASSSFSALPLTISNSAITSEHVVVNSELSNPSAQTGDWTVTTSNGSLTISGSISGATTITLYLMKGV